MKKLERTERIERSELEEWFLNALVAQGIKNVEWIEVRHYVNGEKWHSQEMVAYSKEETKTQ